MWNFRKEILQHWMQIKKEEELQSTMLNEISFTESCLRVNPKSYGSWFHRLWVLQNMPQPDWQKELQLCNKYLELDERNFHCWDYRFLIAKHCQAKEEDELKFSDLKISSNFSNYSSWHYRSKLLPRIYPDPDKLRTIQEKKLEQEFDLVQNAAFTDPDDSSAWFYHQWLLGLGGKPKFPRYFLADRRTLTLIFTGIVTRAELSSKLTIKVNSEEVNCLNWFSPEGFESGSPLWQSTLCNDLSSTVEFCVKMEEVETTFVLSETASQELFTFDSAAPYVVDRMPLTDVTAAVLRHELDSVNQLLDLEPESKWPLLVSVFLMKCLNFDQHRKNITSTLEKLMNIDPLRVGYYQDLKSKYLIEGLLDDVSGKDDVKIDFSGLKLTRLYHPEYFCYFKEVDLSGNMLKDLSGINLLVCCKKLSLDNNRLVSLQQLSQLRTLTHLSIANNCLIDVDDLKYLKGCENLHELDLRGNPVCEHGDCIPLFKTLLPHLKVAGKYFMASNNEHNPRYEVDILKIITPIQFLVKKSSSVCEAADGHAITYDTLEQQLSCDCEWIRSANQLQLFNDQLVAAYDDANNRWRRGRILALYDRSTRREALVYLVDHAQSIHVSINKLQPLKLEFERYPFRSLSITISNLVPLAYQLEPSTYTTCSLKVTSKWSTHSLTFVENLLKDFRKCYFEVDSQLPTGLEEGNLYLSEGGRSNVEFDLRECLVNHKYGTYIYAPKSIEKSTEDHKMSHQSRSQTTSYSSGVSSILRLINCGLDDNENYSQSKAIELEKHQNVVTEKNRSDSFSSSLSSSSGKKQRVLGRGGLIFKPASNSLTCASKRLTDKNITISPAQFYLDAKEKPTNSTGDSLDDNFVNSSLDQLTLNSQENPSPKYKMSLDTNESSDIKTSSISKAPLTKSLGKTPSSTSKALLNREMSNSIMDRPLRRKNNDLQQHIQHKEPIQTTLLKYDLLRGTSSRSMSVKEPDVTLTEKSETTQLSKSEFKRPSGLLKRSCGNSRNDGKSSVEKTESAGGEMVKFNCLTLGNNPPRQLQDFKNINLDEWLVKNLKDIHMPETSQSLLRIWPSVMEWRDVALVTRGLNRLSSFFLPLIWLLKGRAGRIYNSLKPSSGPIVLILCSSWKMANDVYDLLRQLLNGDNCIRVRLFHLGMDAKSVMFDLGARHDILISTPVAFIRLLNSEGVKLTGFKRMCHLLLFGCDKLLEDFHIEIYRIVQYFKKTKKSHVPNQILVCSDSWTTRLSIFIREQLRDPIFYCEPFFETWVYSGVKTKIHMIQSTQRLSKLLELLDAKFEEKNVRIVICVNRDDDMKAIEDALFLRAPDDLLVAKSTMGWFDLGQIAVKWRLRKTFALLLAHDSCINELDVRDADWVIYYNVPKRSKSYFAIRFMFMLDHVQKVDKIRHAENKMPSKCEIHVLVTEKCNYQAHGLILLMKRLGLKVPSVLTALCLGFYEAKESRKEFKTEEEQMTSSTLCRNIKSFGLCKNLYLCEERHLLLPIVDAPSTVYPLGTTVDLTVTCVRNVNQFFGRIVRYKVDDGKCTLLDNEFASICAKLTVHYSKPGMLVPLQPNTLRIGQCASYFDEVRWYRVLVYKLPPANLAHVSEAQIFYVDVGNLKKVKNTELYLLPESLKNIPSPLVEIYMCNVIPLDRESEWFDSQIDQVKQLVENKRIMGNVSLSLGNTLWLTDINVMVISELNKLYLDFTLLKKLLANQIVIKNDSHLPTLQEFVKTVFPCLTTAVDASLLESPSDTSSLHFQSSTSTLETPGSMSSLQLQESIAPSLEFSEISSPAARTSVNDSNFETSEKSELAIAETINESGHCSFQSVDNSIDSTVTFNCSTLTSDGPLWKQATLNVDQMGKVLISSLDNPCNFYVQKVESHKNYLRLKRSLKKHFSELSAVVATQLLGSSGTYYAYVDNRQQYGRGEVLGLEKDGLVNILNSDTGIVDCVRPEDVRLLPSEYSTLELQAIHCSLDGVIPSCHSASWPVEVGNRMWELTIDKELLVKAHYFSKEDQCYYVQLFDNSADAHVSIADLLLAEKHLEIVHGNKEEACGGVSSDGRAVESTDEPEAAIDELYSYGKTPEVEWSQRIDTLKLKIKVKRMKDYDWQLGVKKLYFRCVAGTENTVYVLNQELIGSLKKVLTNCKDNFCLVSTFEKAEAMEWPRLLSEKTKPSWLKVNLDDLDVSSDENTAMKYDWTTGRHNSNGIVHASPGGLSESEKESETENDEDEYDSEDGNFLL
ncbi:hypothetical protein CHUAL_011485 [Chamberlinius hualienensis]